VTAEILPWDLLARDRQLFLAHLRGEAKARPLLGRGWDDAAVAAAAEERRRRPLPHREALAKALRCEALRDPRAVVVVGSQQPALAGGPLLSFAKAVGVLSLANRLEAAGAGPLVPVWWVASEDHDLAEAGAVRIGAGRRGADLLGPDPGDRRMLSRVPSPSLAAIAGDAGGSEFSCEALLDREWPEGASVGTAAAHLFRDLLGPRGLVVVEPQDVRPFARAVFEKEIAEPGALGAAVREGNAAVRAAGFRPALDDPGGPLHFRVDPEGRRTRGGGTRADLDDLGNRLSSDVALRVLAQDAALPVAAQVCGPAEVEYLAALGPARSAVAGFTPCAVPRPGVTILERRVEEALADLGADLPGLYRDGEKALRPAAARTGEEDPLARETRRLRGVLEAAAGEPAQLAASVRSRLGRVRDGLEDLAAASERAAAERAGVGESRRRRVLDALLPDGVPQERRWALLFFLLRHGNALRERLVEELSVPGPGHRVIRV